MGDRLLFWRSMLRDPSRIGAVAPSGRSLATLITANVALDQPIIELGPGTGRFTEALISRGVSEHRLVLVEADPAFAERLRARYPRARVLAMDARHLGDMASLFDDDPVGAIVSGLPLLSIAPDAVAAILAGAFRHLRPGAAMYQFTYLPRCPVPSHVMRQLGLQAARIGSAWANVPPAFVYRFERAAR